MGLRMESARFLIDIVFHEGLAGTVEGHTAHLQERLGGGNRPGHAGAFQPILNPLSAGAFDHAGGNGITGRQGLVLVQTLVVMVKMLANLSPSFPMGRG